MAPEKAAIFRPWNAFSFSIRTLEDYWSEGDESGNIRATQEPLSGSSM